MKFVLFLSVFGVLMKKYFQSKLEQSKMRIGGKFDEILLKELLESDAAELLEIRYDFEGLSARERVVLEHEVVVRNGCGMVYENKTGDKLNEHIFTKNYFQNDDHLHTKNTRYCTGVPCWLGCWFSRTSC